jgi:hypothetical protein
MPVRASKNGVALLMVLVLISILCFLPMAFFLQATMQRKGANASFAISLEASLAEGAIESVMSDLAQEIAWGSLYSNNVVTNVAAGMVYTNTIYYPLAASNAVPMLAGSTGTNGLENLLKRSAYGVSNYPLATCWAVPSSTTNASANGFSIPIARWNKHLLIARASTNSSTDTTPTNTFAPPDWILIARNGSNPTNWSTALRWSVTNTTTVVGRYAFAMYDEGGLLDANVAGYPVGFDAVASSPVSGKTGPYFADLHQIGLNDTQIGALVGWRNYVTASASGNFPSYSVADGGSNYGRAVLGNGNGFMTTYNTNVSGGSPGRTDHQFSSRQQLIAFLIASDPGNIPSAMNALRYLGNFNRDINQPSFAPASNRPKTGTNDDLINPPFLSISVNTTNLVRNNGSTAYVGEPLVKKRFPLNTLSWITYAGPSSVVLTSSNATYASTRNAYINAGIPQKVLDWGTAYNISNYFGLTWNTNGASAGSWTYRSGNNQPILTLAQVSAAGREPDFFELLKAAITYGSLGMAYTSGANSNTPAGYNEQYDNWNDAQILQIGANIIDQFDFDSYPTRILFKDGTTFGGAAVEIRGVEDLPYLYRVREGKVMITDSTPSLASLPMVTNGWSSANGGSGVVLQEPEIWNPHAMRTNSITTPGPTNFRLVAVSTDPITASTNGNNPTINYTLGAVWIPQSGTNVLWQTNAATNLNTSNASLTFSIPINRQDLFREPTLLIKPNIPNGSGLAGSSTYTMLTNISAYQYAAVGVTDNHQYIGIPMGKVPMAIPAIYGSNAIGTGVPATNNSAGIAPIAYVTYKTNGVAGTPSATYLLQCQDASSNWITYDEKYASVANATNGYLAPGTGTNTGASIFQYNPNKTFYVDSNNTTWSKNAIGSEWSLLAFDPRSSRFGMAFSGCNGGTNAGYSFPLGAALGLYTASYSPLYTAGWAAPIGSSVAGSAMQYAAQQNAVLTIRPDEYSGMLLGALSTGPSEAGWFPGGSNSIVRPGMMAQNNPNITTTSPSRFASDPISLSFVNQYFADADGVVRRGMGAFAPFNSTLPATIPSGSSSNPSAIPLLPAYAYDNGGVATAISGVNANANEYVSRPIVLNRPFHSVAELGTVFSGTPWRNLDCSTPESGAASLLDIFSLTDTSDSVALVAGKVNLNTRQKPVIQAILAGAYKEEFNVSNSLVNSLMSSNVAAAMAQALYTRTHGSTAPAGPMMNISELVGKWYASNTVTGTSYVNGSSSYVGFGDDQTSTSTNDITAVLGNSVIGTDPELRVQRIRDATIRALASSGQTRVWNVLIDLFVQSGRYPVSATGFNNFVVDGEIHYWIHLSIDRLTGQLLDRRVETVKE